MKKWILPLLLCLLLCGCQGRTGGIVEVSSLTPPGDTTAQARQGLYAPDSTIEQSTDGAVKAFPLYMEAASGIRLLGENVLVFSGGETTTLTLLTGSTLETAAQRQLTHLLSAGDPSLRINPWGLSYYQPDTREYVVLDTSLREVSRIPLPQDAAGTPILSDDRNTLYYCTPDAILAWDQESGLHRTLKELSYTYQTLEGLHLEGTVLQCRILDGSREETLFLSTQSGQLLHTHGGSISLTGTQDRYYGVFPVGMSQALVFGSNGETPQALIPQDLTANCTFLETRQAAVTASSPAEGSVILDHYDLLSGHRTATLTLPESQYPLAMEEGPEDSVYILAWDPEFGCETLYRWDVNAQVLQDPARYTDFHYTAKAPDLEGLHECTAYAQQLSQKHGVRILVWQEAVAVQPWDYDLQPEYLVSVLRSELEELDRQLSYYPKSLLADTGSHFSSLTICLVRQITGTAESGSLETAAGIQFLDGTDAYVVLSAGEFSDRTLYHELFHVMETHLLGNTTAFDRWDELNPTGFRYDYSYTANSTRDAGIYLRSTERAFVDTYSMSFPKEDRARIMEYAMLPGNEELFSTPIMQRKLQALSDGIREAYNLEESQETFLWEQYLE